MALSLAAIGLAVGSSGDVRYVVELTLALALPWPTVGLLTATRRPSNPIGWLFIAIGVLQAVNIAHKRLRELDGGHGAARGDPALARRLDLGGGAGAAGDLPAAAVPRQPLPSARWRPVGWFAGLAIVGTVVCLAAGLWPLRRGSLAELDFMAVSPFLRTTLPIGLSAFGLAGLLSVLSLMVCFRRSAGPAASPAAS